MYLHTEHDNDEHICTVHVHCTLYENTFFLMVDSG